MFQRVQVFLLLVDCILIASNTNSQSLVGVWQYSANHSPRNFTYPDEFRPDRWLDDRDQKEYEHDHGDAMQPFSVGPRDCVGRK